MLVMAWSSKAPEGTMTAYLARVKMQEGAMIKRSRVMRGGRGNVNT